MARSRPQAARAKSGMPVQAAPGARSRRSGSAPGRPADNLRGGVTIISCRLVDLAGKGAFPRRAPAASRRAARAKSGMPVQAAPAVRRPEPAARQVNQSTAYGVELL